MPNTRFYQLLKKQITGDRQTPILNVYEHYHDIFHFAKGSNVKHQAWQGGYADHITECLEINEIYYNGLNKKRKLDEFTLEEAAISLFFHDFEKPFKYGPDTDPVCAALQKRNQRREDWEKTKWDMIHECETRFGFTLSDREREAIHLTHGEGDDYSPDRNVATPLSAHIHNCDTASARIWPNAGKGVSL